MKKELEELQLRNKKIRAGGGKDKVAKQHQRGKLTARERLDLLLDDNSFNELDAFVKHRCTNFGMEGKEVPGEGVVTGYGTIDQRLVYVYAQDFTVIGGSLGEMHAKKICKVLDLAVKTGAPVIGINDSGGARIQEGVDALSGYGQIFRRNSLASGAVPQIAAIMGPCAGGAVYSPALMDFVFMVEGTSQMFITGPRVIETVTGEKISVDKLGGSMTHNQKSGVAHFSMQSEEECLQRIRELLSYLPSNYLEDPPQMELSDRQDRIDENLLELLPAEEKKVYDIRDLLDSIMDNNRFLEVQQHFACNIITAFGRLNGRSIGIIANQPRVMSGCLDIDASDKGARFIRFCDAFNIPLLNVVDVPGFLPGVEQEFGGIIRHGAKMLYAYSEATVPKITLLVRKAHGGSYLAMCSKDLGADQVLAWPSAEVAVMGPEGAANIIFRKEIENSDDQEASRDKKIEEYKERFANPYVAAERGYVDQIIDPRHTRPSLINAFEMASNKREKNPARKHNNLPL